MRTLRFYLSLAISHLLSMITLGIVRRGRPRLPRIRRMHGFHRLWVTVVARARGRRDGKWYIPAENDKARPAEILRLKQQADALLRRIAADWAKGDARLVAEHQAIDRRRAEAAAEIANHCLPRLRAASRDTEIAQKRLDTARVGEEGRHPDERWRIGRPLYWLGLMAIFLGEFPLNAVAFQLFGEGTAETFIMTGGLAAVLVFCAHGLGVLMRHEVMTRKEEAIAWMLALFPVIVIVAIGIIRVSWLEVAGDSDDVLAGLGPISGTAIFTAINLVIYLGAFILSYLHHDPVAHGVEKLEDELKRARRLERRARAALERETHRLTWYQARLDLWDGARIGAHRRAAYKAWRHKDFFEAFMQSYASANRVAVERRMRRESRAAERAALIAAKRQREYTPPKLRLTSLSVALTTSEEVVVPAEFERDLVPGATPLPAAAPESNGTPPRRRKTSGKHAARDITNDLVDSVKATVR